MSGKHLMSTRTTLITIKARNCRLQVLFDEPIAPIYVMLIKTILNILAGQRGVHPHPLLN